jgi:hypothetical protein
LKIYAQAKMQCHFGSENEMKTSDDKAIMTFHEKFRQYDLDEGHPFRGDRFANAMFFESQGLFGLSAIGFC